VDVRGPAAGCLALPFLAERARRIGDSLARDVNLTLVLHCPAQSLERHWLRVGRTWFIPVQGTHLESYGAARWFRPEWVRSGFRRYPYHRDTYSRRAPKRMVEFASGTPWSRSCKRNLLDMYGPGLIGWFFFAHSRPEVPPPWS
jgi:hypothetical protein